MDSVNGWYSEGSLRPVSGRGFIFLKGRLIMSKYREVSANMNFVEREKETERFWSENRIFEKIVEQREGAPLYTFYDGQPTAN